MPTLEAFTQPAPQPAAQNTGYTCMSLGGQGCYYSAQGDLVCDAKQQQARPTPCTQGPTVNFAERFTQCSAPQRK